MARDVVTLVLANLTALTYAAKGRAPEAATLRDARGFKTAGSVALKRGKLELASTKVRRGPGKAAAKLAHADVAAQRARGARGRQLARRVPQQPRAGAPFQVVSSCKAVEAASKVLELGPAGPPTEELRMPRAKALFRRAVAQTKLGELLEAKADLLQAHELVPDDKEVPPRSTSRSTPTGARARAFPSGSSASTRGTRANTYRLKRGKIRELFKTFAPRYRYLTVCGGTSAAPSAKTANSAALVREGGWGARTRPAATPMGSMAAGAAPPPRRLLPSPVTSHAGAHHAAAPNAIVARHPRQRHEMGHLPEIQRGGEDHRLGFQGVSGGGPSHERAAPTTAPTTC